MPKPNEAEIEEYGDRKHDQDFDNNLFGALFDARVLSEVDEIAMNAVMASALKFFENGWSAIPERVAIGEKSQFTIEVCETMIWLCVTYTHATHGFSRDQLIFFARRFMENMEPLEKSLLIALAQKWIKFWVHVPKNGPYSFAATFPLYYGYEAKQNEKQVDAMSEILYGGRDRRWFNRRDYETVSLVQEFLKKLLPMKIFELRKKRVDADTALEKIRKSKKLAQLYNRMAEEMLDNSTNFNDLAVQLEKVKSLHDYVRKD
ncbi:Hypothetical Protein FCC1311_048402 [Hondaea fermentalgiana]|uniref:Uncharacterized protein n=1 Tax=Hondaea fermentalgiana TaxID=2315210 RepID=A0A2R5GE67_9STRA|nr:Hypothetical Protein FCC1311_048402 [Hondaea fermentalgiana]|eukprot:GBG28619.1 Hypothetical Protein FCC1311_048402 [Hondaea fermentalgiana]